MNQPNHPSTPDGASSPPVSRRPRTPRFGGVTATLALLGVLAGTAGTAVGQKGRTEKDLQVRVDPRVELLSVIFRLAGNPEYGQGRVKSYADDVDRHFGEYRDHPVVKLARTLRQKHGVSYDAVMSMAVHLKDVNPVRQAVPLDAKPRTLEKRWPLDDARRFLTEAQRFVKKTRFGDFLKKHRKLYQTTEKRFQKVLRDHARLGWFDRFFGARPGASFELALAMLNGPCNYGARVRQKNGHEDLYCVLGVWQTDRAGQPSFEPSMIGTVVHEFCHSYANPLVDRHAARLEAAGQRIWPHVAEAMRKQAYGNWKTMLYESMVRACVVRYMHTVEGEAAGRKQIQSEHARSFVWTEGLSDLLARYEADRRTYPDLDAFMPVVAGFFDGYAAAQEEKRREAAAPRVTAMTPANRSRNVDPSLDRIRITFDRAMKNGAWAFVGGGPHYPETTGQPSYDAAGKVITLPVKLKPNWRYEFWLNRGRFNSFQSRDGVPLAPVHVVFETGPGK